MAAWRLKSALALSMALAAPALGGVTFEPTFRLSAEGRYDDDALLAADLAARGEQGLAGQFMTKVSPQLGVDAKARTTTVKSWYAADFLVRHGSGNFTLDHRGGLSLEQRFSDRLSLDWDLQLWRVSDPTSLPRLGMARAFAPVFYGTSHAAASYRITPRWLGRVGYRFEGMKLFDGSTDFGLMHAPYAEAWYRATRRTDLGLDYRLQLFGFAGDSALAHGVSAAVRHRLTPLWGLTVRGGPTWFQRAGQAALAPRAQLELGRDARYFDIAAALGHDLVGASGFTSALWADYASLYLAWHPTARLRIFGAASLYRNGRAANEGWLDGWSNARVSNGYTLGGGAEYRFNRWVSLQVTLDRYAQLGDASGAALRLERNIAAARILFTPW